MLRFITVVALVGMFVAGFINSILQTWPLATEGRNLSASAEICINGKAPAVIACANVVATALTERGFIKGMCPSDSRQPAFRFRDLAPQKGQSLIDQIVAATIAIPKSIVEPQVPQLLQALENEGVLLSVHIRGEEGNFLIKRIIPLLPEDNIPEKVQDFLRTGCEDAAFVFTLH